MVKYSTIGVSWMYCDGKGFLVEITIVTKNNIDQCDFLNMLYDLFFAIFCKRVVRFKAL